MEGSLGDEAGCCTEMNDPWCCRCYGSKYMYVRHDIVSSFLFFFSSGFELIGIGILIAFSQS
jgi:hypothetical protein